jgi:hypothetical protein
MMADPRESTRERLIRALESAPTTTIYIADTLSDRTAALLDSFAAVRPSEGVVYWYGLELGNRAVVTTLIVPDAATHSGAIHTSETANARTLEAIVGTPLQLLGQAHSHPGPHVQHSATDDTETFARFEGMISVVVPYFGRYGLHPHACGIHRYLQGGFWPIPAEDVGRHLVVLPGERDFRRSLPGSISSAPRVRHAR